MVQKIKMSDNFTNETINIKHDSMASNANLKPNDKEKHWAEDCKDWTASYKQAGDDSTNVITSSVQD